jgi:hypothetical protein
MGLVGLSCNWKMLSKAKKWPVTHLLTRVQASSGITMEYSEAGSFWLLVRVWGKQSQATNQSRVMLS